MKKRIFKLSIFTIIVLLSVFSIYNFSNSENKQSFIKDNPYYKNIGMSKKEVKSLPKHLRPDLAYELDYLLTMDPNTGKPEPTRLKSVYKKVNDKIQFTKSQFTNRGIPGDAYNSWEERGPNNVGGRTRALVFDPNDGTGKKVWAGAVTGGLWYNNDITSTTSTWIKVDDFWTNLSVTAIAFDPNNSQIIYVGTGESLRASSKGEGVFKSTDGGQTWNQLPSTTNIASINNIIVRNESGSSVVYLGASGVYYNSSFIGTNSGGLLRSADGGVTWSQLLPVVSNGISDYVSDLELSPDGRIYIGTFYNNFGNGGGRVYYLENNSTAVTLLTDLSSAGGRARTEVAVDPSDENTIYVITAQPQSIAAFEKSTDKGQNWTSLNIPKYQDIGQSGCFDTDDDFARGQADYDLALAVHPTNSNRLLLGGIDLFSSNDGGASWNAISDWRSQNAADYCNKQFVHADQHIIVYNPTNSNEVIFGNDGGVYYSSNAGVSNSPTISKRVRNYNVTQFYAAAIHPDAGSNILLAGAQDNGTQKFTQNGVNSTIEFNGGDGAYCFIDQNQGNIQIASYVYNVYDYTANNGATANLSISGNQNDGLFINPAEYDSEQNILYATKNASEIFRYSGIGGTVVTSSLDITGLTNFVSHLKVSPYTTNSTTLFLGSMDGDVFKVTNANGTHSTTKISNGITTNGSVSCVAIGENEDELLVTFYNYGVSSIWYTNDGGTNWVEKEGNLPDMPVRWALFNPNNYKEVILATEVGTWATLNINASSPIWESSTSGLANVKVNMLKYRTSDNEVVAATYGRGLFTSSGFNNNSTVFETRFSASDVNTLVNTQINLNDESTGTPTSWTWEITPNTYNLLNGTTLNDEVVELEFLAEGDYTITLTSSDGIDTDTETKINYITVSDFLSACNNNINADDYIFGFEPSEVASWTIGQIDFNGDGNTWFTFNDANFAHSGENSVLYQYNQNDNTAVGDDWIVSDCFLLTKDKKYEISFWMKTGGPNFPEALELRIGKADDFVLANFTSIYSDDNLTNTEWQEVTVEYIPTESYDYKLGFYAFSEADRYFVAVDDINIKLVASNITVNTTPADIILDLGSSILPEDTGGEPTATSDCIDNSLTYAYTDATTTGSCSGEVLVTRTWTISDNCGTTEEIVQLITLEDNVNPIITCSQSDVTIQTSNNQAVSIEDYTVNYTATDNANSNIVLTQNPAAGSLINVGSTQVTVHATDGCGNQSQICTFNVIVENSLGLEDKEIINLSIYPNPTSGSINISASEKIKQISLFDLTGKLIYTENYDAKTITTKLLDVNKGTYLLEIKTDQYTSTELILYN